MAILWVCRDLHANAKEAAKEATRQAGVEDLAKELNLPVDFTDEGDSIDMEVRGTPEALERLFERMNANPDFEAGFTVDCSPKEELEMLQVADRYKKIVGHVEPCLRD